MGVEVSFTGADPLSVASAVRTNTKIVWLEVCTNPNLHILDIKKTVERYTVKTEDCRLDHIFLLLVLKLRTERPGS